jgi:5-methyltetrahydropteroyltriglutamate--homocysteine methyltransferase
MAGHVLQLDCPDLAGERAKLLWNGTGAGFVKIVELHVEAINAGIADIPGYRVRMHVCWGNYAGPHVHDFPLEPLLPVLYRARRSWHSPSSSQIHGISMSTPR